jgi:hypothetical protein
MNVGVGYLNRQFINAICGATPRQFMREVFGLVVSDWHAYSEKFGIPVAYLFSASQFPSTSPRTTV